MALESAASDALRIAVGLVWFEGEILIARRHAAAHQGSKWEFPGGKMNAGESAYAAVIRELMEETGLAVAPQRVRRTIHHAYPDRLVELVVIDCEASSKAAQPLGSAEVRWVSPAELSNYDFPAANQTLLAELQAEPIRER